MGDVKRGAPVFHTGYPHPPPGHNLNLSLINLNLSLITHGYNDGLWICKCAAHWVNADALGGTSKDCIPTPTTNTTHSMPVGNSTANFLLFLKKISNKPPAPLFFKYCQDFKTYFLSFFKEQFVSGGNICLYICINIDRLCLVYNVYIHYTFPKQILWLMPIFKRKMHVCRAFSA